MLAAAAATQGKQVIAQGQPGTFPGYATIPTTTNQTLLISQLGNSQQVQFAAAPWQFAPQGITWTGGGGQPQTALLTTGANGQIFIRNAPAAHDTAQATAAAQQPQPQPQPMFIQSPPPQALHAQHPQGLTAQNTLPNLTPISVSAAGVAGGGVVTSVAAKPPNHIQPKGAAGGGNMVSGGGGRPLSAILPPLPTGQQPIRPASSVSTQTSVAQQQQQQQQQQQLSQLHHNQKAQAKMRPKTMLAKQMNLAGQKTDAWNQTKPQSISPQQLAAANNKMIFTSVGALQISAGQQQQQQLQQQQQQQKAVQQIAATNIIQPQQLTLQQQVQQQINFQQAVQQQQQQAQQQAAVQQQQQQQQQQAQQQMMQQAAAAFFNKPPPLVGLTMATMQMQQQQTPQQQQMHQPMQQQEQQQQPQQQQVSLVDRPVMPVVSMPPLGAPPPTAPQGVAPPVPPATPAPHQVQPITPQVVNNGVVQVGTMKEDNSQAPEDKVSTGSTILNAETPSETSLKPDSHQPMENGCADGGENEAPHPLEEAKDKGPPKAMVKPQVLTHVIEGYVIQEASEPFPVSRSTLLTDLNHSRNEKENRLKDADEPPLKKQSLDASKRAMGQCEACNKLFARSKFKKSRGFCSTACANRVANGKVKLKTNSDLDGVDDKKSNEAEHQQMSTDDSAVSGGESSLSPSEAAVGAGAADGDGGGTHPVAAMDTDDTPRINPLKWTVSDVCEFIRNLPGCCDYAEDFAIQEIDGQALMLLKADHLMQAMAMKLGPALKICAKIDTMRCDKPAQGSPEK
ncbi:hypothetical protein LSTR_LSTR014124 [Laodelphax striatellus]|uniref:SAM domain-containing protein n=1 Tax=Laodelphax striatellus TaxID=195883 RepID=A0A482XHB7_LAOST|nr:hypothetical protein LSTR_LSTR014124 [Laodelphax striatellus]